MPWRCRIDFRIGEEGDLFIKPDPLAIGGPSVGTHGIPKICIEASVPNPKFAGLFSLLRTNFGFDKDASKFMILVWFWI